MIRHGSFAFLSLLDRVRPKDGAEMTSPVTVSLEALATESSGSIAVNGDLSLRLALDWWVHVGGSIRDQMEAKFEREIQGARSVEIELVMRPDPVVAFEVNSWLDRRLKGLASRRAVTAPVEIRFAVTAANQAGWIKSVPTIAAFPIATLVSDSVDLKESADLLGLTDLYPEVLYKQFADFLRDDVGVDLSEPPWMFWSRMPVWLKHSDRNADLGEIEARMAFFRSALSPQDERSEAESLDPGSVMMNPTFEAVERSDSEIGSREAPLLVRARQGAGLTSRTITSLEALILDEVRESFRTTRQALAMAIEYQSGVRKEFVELAIAALVRDGFLLGR
jgi:hypothetical protein